MPLLINNTLRMHESEVAVTFRPSGETAYVLPGSPLTEAAATIGLAINFPCGGQGTCGKCRVQILQGAATPGDVEERFFSSEQLAVGWRLACQTQVVGPMEVKIPSAVLAAQHQIMARGQAIAEVAIEPAVRKVPLELPPPQRGDDEPDLLRLERALGRFTPELPVVRQLAAQLRLAGFRGTAVLCEDRLVDFEEGGGANPPLAVAVDVGTTTLATALVDLATGQDLAITSRLNPQTRFGDDVLSRIRHVTERPESLLALSSAVTAAIDEMIGELCRHAGVERPAIYEVCLAGNTTMQQLVCGVDPSSLGQMPFSPTLARGVVAPANELGLRIHPAGCVYVLPVIGGFVGGDIVAGLVATDICATPGPTLLIDIGTNGEIVLWAGGKLTAASTAAGPAFEGARIMHGMRGSVGAIEKVVFGRTHHAPRDESPRAEREEYGTLHCNVIGNVPPRGICGSGLIDAAAELLNHGLMTSNGRLLSDADLPADTPAELRRRMIRYEGKPAFLLASEGEAADGKALFLTQRDLRELQLATGAIRAGTTILLARAGLKPSDLDIVFVAGGFGNFIRRHNAQRIGLLPHELDEARLRYQGNTALAGARLAALSLPARRRGEELARAAAHVDLSTDRHFATAFAEAMLFPS